MGVRMLGLGGVGARGVTPSKSDFSRQICAFVGKLVRFVGKFVLYRPIGRFILLIGQFPFFCKFTFSVGKFVFASANL